MNKRTQLLFVLLFAMAIASVCCHCLVYWLRIETRTGAAWTVGVADDRVAAFMAGSSLAGDGIAWVHVSKQLGRQIGGWGVAGASPFEMEQFQLKRANTDLTFIVVSSYDMNEVSLSDFRADVVPFTHAVRELTASHESWPYSKRVMAQYVTKWLRVPFPTVGRSRGVMGELNVKLSSLTGRSAPQSEEGPTLSFEEGASGPAYKRGKISDWSKGEAARKLETMRTALQGEHSFDGLKKRAFQRMVQRGSEDGKTVVVVVLPVSPMYSENLISPAAMQEFERCLDDVRRLVPRSQWVRLDQSAALQSNDCYWDLVHMNASGQSLATRALLERMEEFGVK